MRPLTLGLIGAAALTVGLLLVRQTQDNESGTPRVRSVPDGEVTPGTISLDRIRAVGY